MNKEVTNFSDVDISFFGPPKSPGVYAVCVKSHLAAPERILYIGSSKNIKARVLSKLHPYTQLFDRFSEYYVYTKTILTDDYISLEIDLIKFYKPLLNIKGNDGKKIHRYRVVG